MSRLFREFLQASRKFRFRADTAGRLQGTQKRACQLSALRFDGTGRLVRRHQRSMPASRFV
jgi:YD repeat-containing protein